MSLYGCLHNVHVHSCQFRKTAAHTKSRMAQGETVRIRRVTCDGEKFQFSTKNHRSGICFKEPLIIICIMDSLFDFLKNTVRPFITISLNTLTLLSCSFCLIVF